MYFLTCVFYFLKLLPFKCNPHNTQCEQFTKRALGSTVILTSMRKLYFSVVQPYYSKICYYMGQSRPIFDYFCSFLITISIRQIEKAQMVCMGFKPRPQDGSRRQNHGTMASATGTFNFYITSPDILLLRRSFTVKCIRQALPIELEKSKSQVGSYKEKLELPPCGSLFSQCFVIRYII